MSHEFSRTYHAPRLTGGFVRDPFPHSSRPRRPTDLAGAIEQSAWAVRDTFITGMIFASAAVAVAQDDDNRGAPPRTSFYGSGGSTLIYLLTKPGIQRELKLDEATSKSLLKRPSGHSPTGSGELAGGRTVRIKQHTCRSRPIATMS